MTKRRAVANDNIFVRFWTWLIALPIIGFFARTSTWLVGIFMIVSNWLVLWQHPVYAWWTKNMEGYDVHETFTCSQLLGAALFGPALISIPVFFAMLTRHLYYRQTIDADIQDGTYVKDWQNMGTDAGARHRIWVSNVVFLVLILAFSIIAASLAKGDSYDLQRQRWDTARINPKFSIALDLQIAKYKRLEYRYLPVTQMRPFGVPPQILYCLHQRESDGSFLCHPHEGSPLTHRTRYVPKGRLPDKSPPYTWLQSAEDAYYVCDKLDRVDWTNVAHALQGIESFNGTGYQKYHPTVPSPYLWSGTTVYTRGKYTGDGRFNPRAVDGQLGCAAILKRMYERGIDMSWWPRAMLVEVGVPMIDG